MRFYVLITVMVAIFSGIQAQAYDLQPKVIKKVSVPPVLDGKLNDTCWNDCQKWPLYDNKDSRKKIDGGTVSVCYDDNNIYAALRLEEPEIGKVKDVALPVNDQNIWNGETLEWFINTNPEGRAFFQFAWNSAGARFSQHIVETMGEFIAPQWNTVSCRGDREWTTEAMVPFAALNVKTPSEGTMWMMNLARSRNIGSRVFSSIIPGIGSFRNTDVYAEIWFDKYVKEQNVVVKQDGPLKALIATRGEPDGYCAFFDPCNQLYRALGRKNVEVRDLTSQDTKIIDWPRKLSGLTPYQCIVIADVPAVAFSSEQLQALRDYVASGGHLIMLGALAGFRHDPKTTWYNTGLESILPMKTEVSKELCSLSAGNIEKRLFQNMPLNDRKNLVRTGKTALINGGKCLAEVTLDKNGTVERRPFIAEKRVGDGSVICIAGIYGVNSSLIPLDSLNDQFFTSKYYPMFWDNLIKYLTGQTVKYPAVVPAEENKACADINFDIIRDNYGDLFKPDGLITVKPQIGAAVSFPCEIETVITDSRDVRIYSGTVVLKQKNSDIAVKLPNLDQGIYKLELVCKQNGKEIASGKARFSVMLPLIENDEFNISVFLFPDYLAEKDAVRIAEYLKAINFNSVLAWTGGTIINKSYEGLYRPYCNGRTNSRLEEAGLRVQGMLYPAAYDIIYSTYKKDLLKPGQVDSFSGLPLPDGVFPGRNLLPWNSFWLNLSQTKAFGRMPLTMGFSVGDELGGMTLPVSDKMKQGYEAVTGKKAPADFKNPESYDFFKYYLNISPKTIWFSRAIYEKYNDKWFFDSVTTPNSLLGHSTVIIDPYAQNSALGSTSVDIYPFGEKKLYQKTLHQLAMGRASTDFGKNAKFGLTCGALQRDYYWKFPEQVFAGLVSGVEYISVFIYDHVCFEKHGYPDKEFAEIARKTNVDAEVIGRTLNNCSRAQSRVAILYPFTEHVHLSMGKEKNLDYLKMSGYSLQYLGLIYAAQVEFEVFRQMAGQVDYIYDQQIRRGDLSKYDALVVGYSNRIEERTMREIVRYVKSGGTLILSTDSGNFNEYGQPTDILYGTMPAAPGSSIKTPGEYSNTRMSSRKSNDEEWDIGNRLILKKNAETLFTFPDKQPACAIGKVGRGEALVLGMPFAALMTSSNASKFALVEYVLNRNIRLISKPHDRDFCVAAFLPKRGEGKIFMIFNGHKNTASTEVTAAADIDEASSVLVDIVNGERIPFTVKDNVMSFKITCPAVWGRALALLKNVPVKVEASVSGPPVIGEKFGYAVRLLGRDELQVPYTLPVKITVTDPEGKVRNDLSGTRIAANGVYVFAFNWPSNALKGEWKMTATDAISGTSDSAGWTVK